MTRMTTSAILGWKLVDSASLAVPHISVVVASNRSRALLDDCRALLIGQCERARASSIIARDDDDLRPRVSIARSLSLHPARSRQTGRRTRSVH